MILGGIFLVGTVYSFSQGLAGWVAGAQGTVAVGVILFGRYLQHRR